MMRIWVVAILLFIFAIGIRLWNLGDAGRWSDEQAILEHGYLQVTLLEQRDVNNPFWYTTANDHPPFVYYVYGFVSKFDFLGLDPHEPFSWGLAGNGAPVYTYDLLASKYTSVFFSALSVVLVFIIGLRYFSPFVGFVSAIILAMLPHFVGLSHYVDLENIQTFFFSLCIFLYLLYLEKRHYVFLIMTGILLGINLMIKESNVIILAFFPATFVAWKIITKDKKLTYKHFFLLGFIAIVVCFAIWPMVFLHPIEYWSHIWSFWLSQKGNTPDVFFGRLMGAHAYYYVVTALITTPVVILILSLFGIRVSFTNRKNWIYVALLIWFATPFLMSVFHHRQHMVRYIVQFYVPLSLLAAIGFEFIIQKFTASKVLKYSLIMPIIVYLAYILLQGSPYYLAYFNELVGGTKNVYEKKLFLIGWFGDGLKNPGIFIANTAKPNSTVGVAADPIALSAVYRVPYLTYEAFNPKEKYDYVIVNYYNVIRMDFNENILTTDYEVVYREKAFDIDYVKVYKHK